MNKKFFTTIFAGALLLLGGCSAKSSSTSKSESVKTETSQSNSSNESKPKNTENDKTVEVNKKSTALGPLRAELTSVRYEVVKNKKSNYTDAEDNLSGKLNDRYYRATLNLLIQNNGKKDIDMSTGARTYIVDSGVGFSDMGSVEGGAFEEQHGSIASNTKSVFTVILISNHKFTVNHLKINFDDIWGRNENLPIHKGGTIEFK